VFRRRLPAVLLPLALAAGTTAPPAAARPCGPLCEIWGFTCAAVGPWLGSMLLCRGDYGGIHLGGPSNGPFEMTINFLPGSTCTTSRATGALKLNNVVWDSYVMTVTGVDAALVTSTGGVGRAELAPTSVPMPAPCGSAVRISGLVVKQ
jgi:hypothetical protein